MRGAELLKQARERAGLTQRELATASGVPQPAIARIESGKADVRTATLERLLAACGETLATAPRPGSGIDRSQMVELLRLTPRQRLELLREDVAGLRQLEQAVAR